jgi:hypothetical protein
VLKVFGAIRGPFSIMLHSPEMAKRILPLVSFSGTKASSKAICAPSASSPPCGSVKPLNASKFPAEEAAIVTYVRQLMCTNRADQAAFDALHKKHSRKWLVELTASVHYCAMLWGIVNAFEVAVPPDGDKLPA